MTFNYTDKQALKRIKAAFGWQEAEFVAVSKNKWTISAVLENGTRVPSHPKGIPATQLKAWVNGADCALLVCDSMVKEARQTKTEAVQDLIPDGDDLVEALKRECEANAVDSVSMTSELMPYLNPEAFTVNDIKGFAENLNDVKVYTDEELDDIIYDATSDAIAETNLYRIAARMAYTSDTRNLDADLCELRHALASEHNVHHGWLI